MIKNKRNGYIILISLIVLSAIAAAVSGSLLLLSLGHSQTASVSGQSIRAQALAEACAETALDSLREDPEYAGGETVVIEQDNCQVVSVLFSDPQYVIFTQASVEGVVRKVIVNAQRDEETPAMQITSWQNVPNF